MISVIDGCINRFYQVYARERFKVDPKAKKAEREDTKENSNLKTFDENHPKRAASVDWKQKLYKTCVPHFYTSPSPIPKPTLDPPKMDSESPSIEQTSKLRSSRNKNPEMSIVIPIGDCAINTDD